MVTSMKTALVSLSLLSVIGFVPVGCSYGTENDAANELCSQMGWVYDEDPATGERVIIGNRYEFMPVGVDPATYSNPTATLRPATGTFEGETREDFVVGEGQLIADDDDLLDDYAPWVEATKLARELLAEDSASVALYAQMDPDKAEGDYTEEETKAVEFIESVVAQLAPMCSRLNDADATGVPPRPGDNLDDPNWPSFTACKDRFDASGDGIVATFPLDREQAQEQDLELAQCPRVDQGQNTRALNVWGPLTTSEPAFESFPEDVRDGFTYSGITVPLESSLWKRTNDRSQWEGIAFWARVADAEEAVPIGPTPGTQEPYSGREIPKDARAQDGVSSLGIIIQTIDTAAVLNERGEMDFMNPIGVCLDGETSEDTFCFDTQEEFDAFPGKLVEGSDPPRKYAYQDSSGFEPDPNVPHRVGKPQTPEVPYCIDYSPVDTPPGEEVPFRDQCWDGFRTMVEIGPQWRFYFLPFSEMRQAGWGRVAKDFRLDQLRSVNILTSAYQPVNVMVDEVAFYRLIK